MDQSDSYEGSYGSAVRLELNPDLPGADTTVTWWLLTGPWHPLWSQFVLSVVSLRDIPGRPPPRLQFLDATHELAVLALDPGDPPQVHTKEFLEAKGLVGPGFLQPIDVVHQFIATDEEMVQLASMVAHAVTDGLLNPSTDDNRPVLREAWLTSCVRTLAHIRGEDHAP